MEAAKALGLTTANWKALSDGARPSMMTIMERTYTVDGTLFFGSARVFQVFFPASMLDSCPAVTILDLKGCKVRDFSAIEALRSMSALYEVRGGSARPALPRPPTAPFRRPVPLPLPEPPSVAPQGAWQDPQAAERLRGLLGAHGEGQGPLGRHEVHLNHLGWHCLRPHGPVLQEEGLNPHTR